MTLCAALTQITRIFDVDMPAILAGRSTECIDAASSRRNERGANALPSQYLRHPIYCVTFPIPPGSSSTPFSRNELSEIFGSKITF